MPAGKDVNEVTPDSLMSVFKGKSLMPIVVFTVVVHIVVIFGSSIPFFYRSVFGPNNAELSEDERIKSAVEDATAALRDIAKKHDLNPKDISSQFASGSRTSAAAAAATDKPAASNDTTQSDQPASDEPAREKSDYEKNLETAADGPTTPTFKDDTGDDIF